MVQLGNWHNWPHQPMLSGTVELELEQRVNLLFSSQNNRRENGVWTGGGHFDTMKQFTRYQPSAGVEISSLGRPFYTGSFFASAPNPAVYRTPAPLSDLGPSAYRRASPDKPYMDLGNSLFELKDLPKMVRQGFDALREGPKGFAPTSLKKVSNFNLAVAFGWLPLYQDCVRLYQAQHELQRVIDRFVRNNGRPVRRRFVMSDVREDREIDSGFYQYTAGLQPFLLTQHYGGQEWSLSEHHSSKVWFSGRFRYWLPEKGTMSQSQWSNMLKRRLFGLNPTPLRVWKAMPWSWLIDWFGNIGDNIANLQTNVADRQMSDYAFLMRHTESFHRVTRSQRIRPTGNGTGFATIRAITESGVSRKERVSASPFGFSLKREDLSPFQLMILGSLVGSRRS